MLDYIFTIYCINGTRLKQGNYMSITLIAHFKYLSIEVVTLFCLISDSAQKHQVNKDYAW